MTKRKAISECKEFWKEIEKSEESKEDFLLTEDGWKWQEKKYANDCPLCQYVEDKSGFMPKYGYTNCEEYCPIHLKADEDCEHLGYDEDPPTPKWFALVKSL